MKEHGWEIAICGTFDVQNYGDLLFPIIAEAELTKRLGPVKLHRCSYHAKSTPEWPYIVTSVTQLPDLAAHLDGVLIGGGFIIRFDKEVAPAYGPPSPGIHHPTGYWLTPALVAMQHGIPLIWNAPGMHCNIVPSWAEPLMRLVLQNSCHIRVRDEPSQEALKHFCNDSQIAVLPDTAFGISRIVNNSKSSTEFKKLREVSGLTGPYIIVQAIHCLGPFIRFAQTHPQVFNGIRVLLLPIGPVLGDHETVIQHGFPDALRLTFWPEPLLLAELISQAEAVVGHSYHLAITALAFGVPVFTSADLSAGKYTALSEFETIFPLPQENENNPQWFLSRLGKSSPSAAAQRALAQLDEHWDCVAKIIREGKADTQPTLGRFLQSLPNLLEVAVPEPAADQRPVADQGPVSDQADQRQVVDQWQIDELKRDLILANAEIRALYSSRSFRLTAPLRNIVRRLNTKQRKLDD
jgi:lipopolysaccharide transport system ATP-binding protein